MKPSRLGISPRRDLWAQSPCGRLSRDSAKFPRASPTPASPAPCVGEGQGQQLHMQLFWRLGSFRLPPGGHLAFRLDV